MEPPCPVQWLRYKAKIEELRPVKDKFKREKCWGEYLDQEHIIEYDPDGDRVAQTILHECTHAVRDTEQWSGGKVTADMTEEELHAEEVITTNAANAVMAFIADNPAFCRWVVDYIDATVNRKKPGPKHLRHPANQTSD